MGRGPMEWQLSFLSLEVDELGRWESTFKAKKAS